MHPTYRVRYSSESSGQRRSGADVLTADLVTELEGIPGLLPPGSYVLYVDDVAADRAVHWTRWPASFRPGAGG